MSLKTNKTSTPTKRTRKDQGLIEGASFIDSKGKAYVVIDGEMVHVKPGWKKRLKAKAAKQKNGQ